LTRLERAFVGLYGGAWLALLGVAAICLWQGRAWPLLEGSGGYGARTYLILWLVLGVPLAFLPRADLAWRVIMAATSLALIVNAVLGWWRHPASAAAMVIAMVGFALLMAVLLPLLDAARVRKRRPRRATKKQLAGVSRPQLVVGWVAWTVAVCVSFGMAFQGPGELRGAAQGMWLLVLFVALPAVVAGAWSWRAAATGLVAAVVASGFFHAPVAGLSIPPLALLIGAAGFVLLRPKPVALP